MAAEGQDREYYEPVPILTASARATCGRAGYLLTRRPASRIGTPGFGRHVDDLRLAHPLPSFKPWIHR